MLLLQALVISNAARRTVSVGSIVNLVAVDLNILNRMMNQLNYVWSAPIIVILSTVFLWQQIGPSCLAGIVLLAILLPTNAIFMAKFLKKVQVRQEMLRFVFFSSMECDIINGIIIIFVVLYFGCQRKQMKLKEERLNLTSQIFSGVKVGEHGHP